MAKEITLQHESLQKMLDTLKQNISQINDDHVSNAFQTTNIEPFINDLENFHKALLLLQTYKSVLQRDVHMIQEAIYTIEKTDVQLSRSYGINWEYTPK